MELVDLHYVEEPGPRIRVETFWDSEPGLDGSVTLRFDEGTLVPLSLSLAPSSYPGICGTCIKCLQCPAQ